MKNAAESALSTASLDVVRAMNSLHTLSKQGADETRNKTLVEAAQAALKMARAEIRFLKSAGVEGERWAGPLALCTFASELARMVEL